MELGAGRWDIRTNAHPDDPFVHAEPRDGNAPVQGWKLHLSAISSAASEVLARTLPVLARDRAPFKVVASPAALEALNRGEAGTSQIGKFITVYPADPQHAVELAVALDRATAGLPGPLVPSDRRLRPGSIVHYRFGDFRGRELETASGALVGAVEKPDGNLEADLRGFSYRSPAWAEDPFEAAGLSAPRRGRRAIGRRFVPTSTLSVSPRGTVSLALDVEEGNECVLKSARRHSVASPDRPGIDALSYLSQERDVLRGFSGDPRFPQMLGWTEEDDEAWLALSLVPGHSLAEAMGTSGGGLAEEDVIRVGVALARALSAIHSRGYVFRDLAASNVQIDSSGAVGLLDFELACLAGAADPLPCVGTRGYCSPQQAGKAVPALSDDVYSLGAILYLMATGADPRLSPDPFDLLSRPLHLMAPHLDARLEEVIGRCLAIDPAERFATAGEVAAELVDLGTGPRRELARPSPPSPESDRALAGQLGESLAADVHAWGEEPHDASLYSGRAGIVLALAELSNELRERSLRVALTEAADHLRTPSSADHGGLYAGPAGVGLALLRAGQVLGDQNLITESLDLSRAVARAPSVGCDLVSGLAGELRFHTLVAAATRRPAAAAAAEECARLLVERARSDGDEAWWPRNTDLGPGAAQIGYAHGAAGIADALLEHHEQTGSEVPIETIRSAIRWIARSATASGEGLDWPASSGGVPGAPMWCHGATGVARLLLRASRHAALGLEHDLLSRATVAIAAARSTIGPVACHGLAGSIDLLIDAWRETGDAAALSQARELGALLRAYVRRAPTGAIATGDSPHRADPSLMTGYAGVALAFLRLSDPRLPHWSDCERVAP
jgi:serine/threonine protein kinase